MENVAWTGVDSCEKWQEQCGKTDDEKCAKRQQNRDRERQWKINDAEGRSQNANCHAESLKLQTVSRVESLRPQLALSSAIWDLNKYFDAVKIQMGIQVAQKYKEVAGGGDRGSGVPN